MSQSYYYQPVTRKKVFDEETGDSPARLLGEKQEVMWTHIWSKNQQSHKNNVCTYITITFRTVVKIQIIYTPKMFLLPGKGREKCKLSFFSKLPSKLVYGMDADGVCVFRQSGISSTGKTIPDKKGVDGTKTGGKVADQCRVLIMHVISGNASCEQAVKYFYVTSYTVYVYIQVNTVLLVEFWANGRFTFIVSFQQELIIFFGMNSQNSGNGEVLYKNIRTPNPYKNISSINVHSFKGIIFT